MNILIVDDEAPARLRLRQLIDELPGHRVVGEADGGDAALAACSRERVDVVLLDIRMPGRDGLAIARQLVDQPDAPAIVFVTAFAEHAVDAFDVQASDYLVKPVRRERLIQALARVADRAGVSSGVSTPPAAAARGHLRARLGGVVRLIPIDEVRYFRAEQKYVTVRDGAGECLIEDTLSRLEAEFAGRFVRAHRNALVAVHYLQRLQRQGLGHGLWLQGCSEPVAVSRRHLPVIRQALRIRQRE
ncbi:MAG: LytR/AlgR family response regulator transcription factor [Pseudomonadota bacterium]